MKKAKEKAPEPTAESQKKTVAEEMREALHKRAVGYDVEEQDVVYSNGSAPKIVKKRRHVPGDPKAMMQYLALYGDDET